MLHVASLRAVLLVGLTTGAGLCADDVPPPDPYGAAIGLGVIELSAASATFKELKADVPAKAGVVVAYVAPGSPGAAAKVSQFDIITKVNKLPVRTVKEYRTVVSDLEIGKKIDVIVFHASAIKGRVVFKSATAKMVPVRLRDIYLGAMKVKTDEVNDLDIMSHSEAPTLTEQSDFGVYIVRPKGGKPKLRLRIQYVAEDWLFISRFILRVGDEKFTVASKGIERDNSGGKIWEWYDEPVTDSQRKMINSIVSGDRTILRCEGSQYAKDRDLSREEAGRLWLMMDAYRVLGGE